MQRDPSAQRAFPSINGRPLIPIGLIFDAELKTVSGVGDAKDRAADGLWLARARTFLFQTDKDRLRFRRVELQDDPSLIADASFGDQLAVERGKLAIGRVHEEPDFL